MPTKRKNPETSLRHHDSRSPVGTHGGRPVNECHTSQPHPRFKQFSKLSWLYIDKAHFSRMSNGQQEKLETIAEIVFEKGQKAIVPCEECKMKGDGDDCWIWTSINRQFETLARNQCAKCFFTGNKKCGVYFSMANLSPVPGTAARRDTTRPTKRVRFGVEEVSTDNQQQPHTETSILDQQQRYVSPEIIEISSDDDDDSLSSTSEGFDDTFDIQASIHSEEQMVSDIDPERMFIAGLREAARTPEAVNPAQDATPVDSVQQPATEAGIQPYARDTELQNDFKEKCLELQECIRDIIGGRCELSWDLENARVAVDAALRVLDLGFHRHKDEYTIP